MHHTIPFLNDPLIAALGWTVLHSLWQAAGIALLLLPIHWALRRQPAQWRYLLALAALASVCAVSAITFIRLYAPAPAEWGSPPAVTASPLLLLEAAGPDTVHWLDRLEAFFQEQLPLLVTLWLIGLLFFSFRLLGGLLFLQHLRHSRGIPLAAPWQNRLREIANHMGIRRAVQWRESARVQSPLLIGWLKPLILFPLGTVNRLSPDEVEAILAHELAHVRRHDFFINLLQSIVETLYYFNPAVWWISDLIRTEREHVCDDLAIAHSRGSLSYARALLSLQQWQQPAPTMALGLFGHRPLLLQRIRRILRQPQPKRHVRERLGATLLLLAVGLWVGMSQKAPAAEAGPLQTPFTLPPVSFAVPAIDTLPDETASYRFTRDGQLIEAELVNGRIQELKVDGRSVPEGEFSAWEDRLARWIRDIPEPPRPPMPPAPPSDLGEIAPPPPPPAPPAPSIRVFPKGEFEQLRIETEEREDGSIRMTLRRPDRPDTVLQFHPGEDMQLLLDDLDVIVGESERLVREGNLLPRLDLEDLDAPFIYSHSRSGLSAEEQEDIREEIEEKREAMEEAMEEYREARREAMEEYREAQREAQEEYREAMEEIRRARQEVQAAERKAQRESMQAFRRQQDERQRRLEEELLRDGLIDDPRNYKLDLNDTRLKVNGKKQPDELYRKYRELLGSEGDVLIRKSSS